MVCAMHIVALALFPGSASVVKGAEVTLSKLKLTKGAEVHLKGKSFNITCMTIYK